MTIDLYSVLAVPRNATTHQIRTSFRRLARERHPDLYQGEEKVQAESAFQELTEAFNVLSNPERRRQYDDELRQASGPQVAKQRETATVWVKRGIEAFRTGNLARAEADLEQATVEDPDFARAWYLLARTRQKREQRAKAGQAALRACELEPTTPDYLQLAGELLAATGRHDEAKTYYRKALSWGADQTEVEQALTDLERQGRGAR